jgi:hypothetical protein
MKRPLLAFVLALSVLSVPLSSSKSASAQVTGPLPNPPQPGSNQTATLLFNTMLAVSRAATANAQNAQAAAMSYQQAIQRYNVGDISGARTAALQALITADQVAPQPLATLPPMPPASPIPVGPQPIGNIAQIDADAFVAAARRSVEACVSAHDPNTNAAEVQLAAAERAQRGGKYNDARAAARNAVNLCAAAQAAANRR